MITLYTLIHKQFFLVFPNKVYYQKTIDMGKAGGYLKESYIGVCALDYKKKKEQNIPYLMASITNRFPTHQFVELQKSESIKKKKSYT